MAKNDSKESRTLEIRKYQNRRYYDSTHSRHLTLEQIHRLIIEGYNIRVLDAKTNEDITSRVLTQILLEYEPVNLDVFSNELLIRAIRVNDRLLKDFVDVYFRQAFEAFCGSQNQVDQMLRQAHHLTSILPAAAVSSAANLFRPWMPLTAPVPPAPAKTNDLTEEPASPGVQNEIAALREEVAELKAQLKQQKQTPGRRQRKNSK
jgi:polyhydroxyalkanoate synthesis repressor PhaR